MAWSKVSESYNPLVFESLLKAEPSAAMSPKMYADLLVPTVGNMLAYKHFRDDPGAHVRVDVADMGEINDSYGFEAGNKVLQVFGKISSELANQFGGKSARYGGDEFAFHFKKPDNAHAFARALRATLEKIPPIGNTHALAAAIGVAPTAGESDHAMHIAKQQRYRPDGSKKYPDGQAPSVVYSAMDLAPAELAKSDPDKLQSLMGKIDNPNFYGYISPKDGDEAYYLMRNPAKHSATRWASNEGTKRLYIPHNSTPEWNEYEEKYNKGVQEKFGGEGTVLLPWDHFPVKRLQPSNMVFNYDRFEMYKDMLAAGHPTPRIVVSAPIRNSLDDKHSRFSAIDGSHRVHAAQKAGVPTLRGFLQVREPDAHIYQALLDQGVFS